MSIDSPLEVKGCPLTTLNLRVLVCATVLSLLKIGAEVSRVSQGGHVAGQMPGSRLC